MAIKDLFPIQKFNSNGVEVPTFLTGRIKEETLPEYQKEFSGNPIFEFYDTDQKDARGSNAFIVGGLNKVLKDSKFRMPVPTDNIYESIFPMIENNFYTDLNAFDVKEKKPIYEKNNGIWRQAKDLIEEREGTLKLPSRIQGFYFELDEEEGEYGVRITPAKNFRIIPDKRLNLTSGTSFNSLDEIGMINPLNKGEEGKYSWYSREDGLLRVHLHSDGNLFSDGDDMEGSFSGGRGVIVDAEGVAQKFSADSYRKDIEEFYQKKVASAEKIKNTALRDLAKL